MGAISHLPDVSGVVAPLQSFWSELIKRGAVNFEVASRPLENLESYLRGKRDAMSIVAVPSPLQEQQRSVVRYREQLVRNRRRAEARGRALALTQGILAPVGWWRPAAWKQFKTQLPEWMGSQLEHWQEEALAVDAKERQILRELEHGSKGFANREPSTPRSPDDSR